MAKKKNLIEDRLKDLEGHIDPDKGKTEVTAEDITLAGSTSTFLSELRSPTPSQTSHKSVKIKTQLYNDLKRIAQAEGLSSYGKLMTAILEDWIKKYDAGDL